MEKMKWKTMAVIAFITFGLASCSGSDDPMAPPYQKSAFVTTVEGPETGTVNTELTYIVSFTVDNNCGAFYNMLDTTEGTTKTLEVKAIYYGSNCNTTPQTKTTAYKFIPTAAGTYSLRFRKSATEFVTKTVTVN